MSRGRDIRDNNDLKRRTMKSLRVILALLFVVVVIVACSAKPKDLTGNWQLEGGSGTIEFTKDGKMNMAGGPGAISAPYKVEKENLQVDLGIFGTGALKYVLAKDTLTITDAKGNSVKYARAQEIKNTKESKPQEAPKAHTEPAAKSN